MPIVPDDDAVAKVKKLLALADDERAPEGERSNARDAAIKLRLKHGISDADLEESEHEDMVIMGVSIFRYSNVFQPKVKQIKAAVEHLVKLAEEGPDPIRDLWQLYDDLRLVVEGNGFRSGLHQARDAAIKKEYLAQVEHFMKEDPEMGEAWIHHQAFFHTRLKCSDIRKDHLERIVGASSKAIGLKLARQQMEKERQS